MPDITKPPCLKGDVDQAGQSDAIVLDDQFFKNKMKKLKKKLSLENLKEFEQFFVRFVKIVIGDGNTLSEPEAKRISKELKSAYSLVPRPILSVEYIMADYYYHKDENIEDLFNHTKNGLKCMSTIFKDIDISDPESSHSTLPTKADEEDILVYLQSLFNKSMKVLAISDDYYKPKMFLEIQIVIMILHHNVRSREYANILELCAFVQTRMMIYEQALIPLYRSLNLYRDQNDDPGQIRCLMAVGIGQYDISSYTSYTFL